MGEAMGTRTESLREPGEGEVDHLMAAVVEFLARRLSRGRLVEREVEHASGGAEPLLLARRMPPRREALRREHDESAAGARDRVSAGLFERAHEGRDAGPAGPDSRGGGDEGVPVGRVLGGRAVSLERHEHGQFEQRAVAVGEPAAAEEVDGRDLLEEEKGANQPQDKRAQARAALTDLFQSVKTEETPIIVEQVVNDIDNEVVNIIRQFTDAFKSVTAKREIKKKLRSILWVKYQIKDQEVFDRAYQYIEMYY